MSHRDTEIEITVRYGYAVSIGRLVWALTYRERDWKGTFNWGTVTGDIKPV